LGDCSLFEIKMNFSPKRILILKIDSIGDYVLFRNFLSDVKKHFSCHITLIGNELWKDLALEYDSDNIDSFIWINTSKFSQSRFYRRLVFVRLNLLKSFDLLFSSACSRRFYFEDELVKRVAAREKIGVKGDLLNCTENQKAISDKYYTQLIEVNEIFEFYKNRAFFEAVTGLKLTNTLLSIPVSSQFDNQKYAVLFIGAADEKRRWANDHFVEIARWLLYKYNLNVKICGSKDDVINANKIELELADSKVQNLVGATSIPELVQVIAGAKILISNDTSAVHIAAAVNRSAIAICKGNYYKRFHPYPIELRRNIVSVFPPDFYMANPFMFDYNKIDINIISTEIIKNEIDKLLIN